MSQTNLWVWFLHWRVAGSNPGADKDAEGVLVGHPQKAAEVPLGSSCLPVTPKVGKWPQKSKKETPNYIHLHGHRLISFSVPNDVICGAFLGSVECSDSSHVASVPFHTMWRLKLITSAALYPYAERQRVDGFGSITPHFHA